MEETRFSLTAKQNWRELYNNAMAELNPAEQRTKIDLASAAIHHRLYELANDQGTSSEEQQAILDALQTMQAVQGLKSVPSADATQSSGGIAEEEGAA